MPNPNIKNHGFKKGVSGNPLGGKLHNKELKAVRFMTKEEMAEVGKLILDKDFQQLREMADALKTNDGKKKDISVLKAMVASVAMKIISKGDMHALDILLNRLIGKVKDEVDISGKDGSPLAIVVKNYVEKKQDEPT